MFDTGKSQASLLDGMVALDQAERQEVAEELRKVSDTFAEVPDGRRTAVGVSHREGLRLRRVGSPKDRSLTADGIVRAQKSAAQPS